jgi:hypothetical protein
MTARKGTRPSSSTPLMERAEWLSARDIADVFGVGLTKAYRVCQTLPHIYVGRSIRVNKASVVRSIRETGGLPSGDYVPRRAEAKGPAASVESVCSDERTPSDA